MICDKRFLPGVMVIACLVSVASAQEARPAGLQMKEGDWTLVPIVSHSPDGWSAAGVLALRDKQNAVGDNIVAIWYEHAVDGGNGWSAVSWTSQNQWDAINYVKRRFHMDDARDFMWPTTDAPSGTEAEAETPAPYFKGLPVSDPMAEIPVSPQRDEMLLLLTQVGYQSATIEFEKNDACTGEQKLTALCDTAILGASTELATENLERFLASLVPESCRTGQAPLPPTGTLLGTRIVLPGLPIDVDHPWKRSDQPPELDPNCSTATTCCYSVTIICLYWREGMFGLRYLEFCTARANWSCPRNEGESCPLIPSCSSGDLLPEIGTVTCGHALN